MKRLAPLVGITFLLSISLACAPKPLPPPEFTYGKSAIRLQFKADKDLNLYQGASHTLLLCVYQLRDPNAFNQLVGDEDGLYKLLECGSFDPSVTNVKRLIVQPGQEVSFALDRAEGTRYVGLVAGYSIMKKENMIRLLQIPIVIEKKGFIRTTKTQKPGLLDVTIYLGAQGIKQATTQEKKK